MHCGLLESRNVATITFFAFFSPSSNRPHFAHSVDPRRAFHLRLIRPTSILVPTSYHTAQMRREVHSVQAAFVVLLDISFATVQSFILLFLLFSLCFSSERACPHAHNHVAQNAAAARRGRHCAAVDTHTITNYVRMPSHSSRCSHRNGSLRKRHACIPFTGHCPQRAHGPISVHAVHNEFNTALPSASLERRSFP